MFKNNCFNGKYYQRLEHYLECELLLNLFFEQNNYCLKECISKKISLFNIHYRPRTQLDLLGIIGCCPNNTYIIDDEMADNVVKKLLIYERGRKYGYPVNDENALPTNESACAYHRIKSGCLLKTHKPPKCLSFICSFFKNYLEKRFNIYYDKESIELHLNFILSDKFNSEVYNKEVQRTKSNIIKWIEIIKNTMYI